MLVVGSDLCKLVSFVSLMEGQISVAALCAVCIRVACRMLNVRRASEQPWNNAVAVRLRCLKERLAEGLLEFVVLHAACDEGKIVRVDAFTLMRVG